MARYLVTVEDAARHPSHPPAFAWEVRETRHTWDSAHRLAYRATYAAIKAGAGLDTESGVKLAAEVEAFKTPIVHGTVGAKGRGILVRISRNY